MFHVDIWCTLTKVVLMVMYGELSNSLCELRISLTPLWRVCALASLAPLEAAHRMQANDDVAAFWRNHPESAQGCCDVTLTQPPTHHSWLHSDGNLTAASHSLPLMSMDAAPGGAEGAEQEEQGAVLELQGLAGMLGEEVYDSLLRDSSGGTGETLVQEVLSCGFGWDPCTNAATAAAEAAAAAAAAAAAGAIDVYVAGVAAHESWHGSGECGPVAWGRYSVDSASSGGLFEGWLAGDAVSSGPRAREGATVESADAVMGATFDLQWLPGGSGPPLDADGGSVCADGSSFGWESADAPASEGGAGVEVKVENFLGGASSSRTTGSAEGEAPAGDAGPSNEQHLAAGLESHLRAAHAARGDVLQRQAGEAAVLITGVAQEGENGAPAAGHISRHWIPLDELWMRSE